MGEADEERCLELMWRYSIILIVACICGIIAFFLFLLYRPEHIYIQQLSIQEDFSNSSKPNTSIIIDLKFRYPLHSSDVNITLYCASCQSISTIGYCVVPGFNHGFGTAHREAVVVPRGPSWDEAQRKRAQGSRVELRVEMTTGFINDNCRPATPVKVVADFLLDGSNEVLRIS